MTGRQSGPEIAGQIGLGLALLAAAGFRWAIAGRGLDFTDESFALLAAGHPEELRVSPSLFSFYIAPLFTLAGGDIAAIRRVGLLIVLAAAAALAKGVTEWLRGEPGALKAPGLFAVVALGSLVYYSRGISIPNYNLVTSCGLAMGFGLLLVALREGAGDGRIALVGSGFALASAAASKPPTILALAVAAGWLIARRRPARGLVWLLAGAAVAGALPLAAHSPREVADTLKTGVEFTLASSPSHRPQEALAAYAADAFQLVVRVAGYIALPLLAGLMARATGTWFSGKSLIPLAVLLVVLVFDGALLGGRSAARSGRTAAAILAAIIVCADPSRALLARMARSDRWPVLLGALTLPVLGVLGTNTAFSSALLLFIGPWFLLVPISMAGSSFGGAERLLRSAAPALIAAIASTSAPYTSPYGLTSPFSAQTVSVTLGQPPTSILTDPKTARFLDRLQRAARRCGFTPGQDIIPLLEMPGFVFALGGVSPATSYYDARMDAKSVSLALSSIPEERLRRSFVLLNEHGEHLGDLRIGGRHFPRDYSACFDRYAPTKYGDLRVRLLRPRPDP